MSSGESENAALLFPADRKIGHAQQRAGGKRFGLLALKDRGDDAGRQKPEPGKPFEITLMEPGIDQSG